VSVRCTRGRHDGVLITPTGLGYETLRPDDLVFLRLADGAPTGRRAASSEWRFHLDILRARPQFAAIVHTHSPSATALACHGRAIPPFHYMVAAAAAPTSAARRTRPSARRPCRTTRSPRWPAARPACWRIMA